METAVAIVASIVIVQQVIIPRRAVRLGVAGQRGEVLQDRGDSRLRGIGAIAVGAAALTILSVPIVGSGLRIWILDLIGRRRQGVARGRRCNSRRRLRPA
jgi:hypothetical protein